MSRYACLYPIPIVWLLLLLLVSTPLAKAGTAPEFVEFRRRDLPARILEFPFDRWATARVYLMARHTRGSVRLYSRAFKDLGLAKGDVAVPAGGAVCLIITMEGAEQMASLSKLKPDDIQMIKAHSVPLRTADLTHIGQLTGLEQLECFFTDFDDGCLFKIARFVGLEALILHHCNIGDANLAELSRLKKLRLLHLDYNQVGNAGVKAICDSSSIVDLSLEGNRATRACVDDLLKMKQLESLSIPSIGLEDVDLMKLAKLKRLRFLKLGKEKTTSEGEAAFRKARPDCKLVHMKVYLPSGLVL